MKKQRLVILAMTCIGGMSLVNAQLDRNFWKTDAEIDEFYGNAATERGAASQRESLASIMDRISKLDQHPSTENIPYLGECLRKLSRGNIFQLKERIEVYDNVQSKMLSIPGHARYFADEIKREQKEVAHYPTVTGPRVSYDRTRGWYFLTMRHLPSPETIAVLGEFLADDKDRPDPRDPSKSYDYDIPLANSHYAAETLDKIGLRDPPVPPARHQVYPLAPEDYLPYARAWWEEVKTGERTFSFKGQAVEYRFKPDGTWDTIPIANPPDDGPQPTHENTSARPVKRPGADRVDTPEPPAGHAWWWYGIGGTALLVMSAWFMRKKDVG